VLCTRKHVEVVSDPKSVLEAEALSRAYRQIASYLNSLSKHLIAQLESRNERAIDGGEFDYANCGVAWIEARGTHL